MICQPKVKKTKRYLYIKSFIINIIIIDSWYLGNLESIHAYIILNIKHKLT